MKKGLFALASTLVLSLGISALATSQAPTRPASSKPAGPLPLMAAHTMGADAQTALVKQYCVTCHNDRTKAGTLSLAAFDAAQAADAAMRFIVVSSSLLALLGAGSAAFVVTWRRHRRLDLMAASAFLVAGVALLVGATYQPAYGASQSTAFAVMGCLAAGLAAILGHNFTPFLRFRGGKGVATSFGQCLYTFPAYAPFDVALATTVARLPGLRRPALVSVAVSSVAWLAASVVWWRRGFSSLWGPRPSAARSSRGVAASPPWPPRRLTLPLPMVYHNRLRLKLLQPQGTRIRTDV